MTKLPKKGRGRPRHDDVLTPAEWRVVHAVQHGMTDREIAGRRGISRDAVKYHVTNVIAKLGLPNRKALRQWFLPPKGSAISRVGKEMTSPIKLGPIGQISRSVKDISAAEAWYGEVLGIPHLYTFADMAFFDCGGVRLILSRVVGDPPAESIVYLKVADIQTAYEELKARGVDFINGPHMVHRHADGTEEWMAFFKDPEGRPLALMSQVAQSAAPKG
jgi:DNA-binding CsgD family transcriptional regulator/predicted enzyme related to lactoylglutathione lyase